MYDLLIRNAVLVTPDGECEKDMAIQNGKIAAFLERGTGEAECEIDASGRYAFPGIVDPHAHLNEPGWTWREDYEHGTKAAAVGGVTTVIDMPLNTAPSTTTAQRVKDKIELVEPSACIDFALWGGLVPENFDELEKMDKEGCVAFKAFLSPSSPDFEHLGYGETYEAMQIIKRFGGRIGFHCEDYSTILHLEEMMRRAGRFDSRAFLDSRPVVAEMIATEAVIALSKATGCKSYICHISSPDVAQKVKLAQQEGVDILAETCVHYLCMNENDVLERGAFCKCSPPLRTEEESRRLWDYVLDGTICAIGSDHSPCTAAEKTTENLGKKVNNIFDAWGGMNGIQTAFQTMYSEGCGKRGMKPAQLAKLMCEGPARAFGLWGKKGALREGFDADVVLLDPNKPWEVTADTLYYKNKISGFLGKTGVGMPVMTILRGEIIAENGAWIGKKSIGKVLRKGSIT